MSNEQNNQLATIEKSIKSLGPTFGRYNRNKEEIIFGRECKFALQAVSRTAALQRCEMQSIQDAVLQVANVGLSLNPALGYCYLVPLNEDDEGTKTKRAALWIGYKGMEKLGTDGGGVAAIEAQVVFAADEFFIEQGSTPRIIHRIKSPTKRGDPIGAYCIATLPSGQKLIEWMDKEQIMKAKAVAKTKKVWDGPFGLEQWRKTVIRRAWKHWPRSPALEHAEQVMQELEPATFEEPSPQQKEKAADKEPVLCVTDEQVLVLHSMLTDNGAKPETADKWLKKLAESYGYASISALPLEQFEEAKAKLKDALTAKPEAAA